MTGPQRLLVLLSFSLLNGFAQYAVAQEGTGIEQVQAIVSGLRTAQEALVVDRHLGHIPGVLLSRTDLHTSNLFMLVKADSPDQEQAVRAALDLLGLRLGCWTRTPRSDRPFTHLVLARCTETPLVR